MVRKWSQAAVGWVSVLLVLPVGLAMGLLGMRVSGLIMFSPNPPEFSVWVGYVGVPQGLAFVAVVLALLNITAVAGDRAPAPGRAVFARVVRWAHAVVGVAGLCAMVLIVSGGLDRFVVPDVQFGAVALLLGLPVLLGFSLVSFIALAGVGRRAPDEDAAACRERRPRPWLVLIAGQFGAVSVGLGGGYWLVNWLWLARESGGFVLSPHPWVWAHQLLGLVISGAAVLTTAAYLRAAVGWRWGRFLETGALLAWGLVIAGFALYIGVMLSLGGWVIGATLGSSALGGIIVCIGGLLFLRLGRPGRVEDPGSWAKSPRLPRGGL